MKTISGREVNIEDIVLYKLGDVGKSKRIALLVRENIDSKPEIELIPYSEVNESVIVSGMKQIREIQKTDSGNVRVIYKDDSSVILSMSNYEVASNILKKQNEIVKNKEVASFDEKDIERKNENDELKRKNKALKKWISGAVAALLVGGAISGHFIANKDKGNDENAIPTPTPGKEYNMSDEELEKITTSPKISLSEDKYLFDINNEAVMKAKGIELYNEVINKNIYLLTEGLVVTDGLGKTEKVEFNETLATELVYMINGVFPETMKGMDEETIARKILILQEATYLYTGANSNPESKDILNMADYVAHEGRKALLNNSTVLARNVAIETVGNPVNGAIIETDEEMNKFNRAYLNATDELLNYEIDTKTDPVFMVSDPWFKWVVVTTFESGNAIIPQWSYVLRTSEDDRREHEYPYRYFLNDTTSELWRAVPGANGTTEYEWTNEECEVKRLTEREMFDYDEKDINIHQMGIEQELKDIKTASDPLILKMLTADMSVKTK